MTTIHAIYSNGVFKPQEFIDLPENAVVEFEPRLLQSPQTSLQGVVAILKRRFHSGVHDAAERHNEHHAPTGTDTRIR